MPPITNYDLAADTKVNRPKESRYILRAINKTRH